MPSAAACVARSAGFRDSSQVADARVDVHGAVAKAGEAKLASKHAAAMHRTPARSTEEERLAMVIETVLAPSLMQKENQRSLAEKAS
mmetsp:Transcript_65972/g.193022  ORF Transcript_65972/g.193022 Transcript_65972/m.193022 type:complete len:87 (-) Transcript_65972:15-275(-)